MKFLLSFVMLFLLFFVSVGKAHAVVNPLEVANNKVGMHILFTDELDDAAALVNANGGKWGYVIIPIQAGEKDLDKWQKFMDEAKRLEVIPIIRIASEGDYFNTKVWRKPTEMDILDFANFLHSLSWPTKNRYVVVFNEVNRADEWGGQVNPVEYAKLLSYAVTVFKSKSQDFFIISTGMDNAAANTHESMNGYDYMRAMNAAVPNIFSQVDGLGSHSYPNPAFSQPPTKQDSSSVASFRYESQFVQSMVGKNLPVFITETGWSSEKVSPFMASVYLQTAFASVWSDENVVAVTPFVFKAAAPFAMFSFLHADGSPTPSYKMLFELPKNAGAPVLAEAVLGDKTPSLEAKEKVFSTEVVNTAFEIPDGAKVALKWFLKMPI